MKKYLSLIAILALLVACMVPAASAAEGLEVIIDSKTVEMGEGTAEVVLEVKTGETGIAGGQFDGLTVSEGATIKAVTSVGVVAPYNAANGKVAFFNAMGTDVNGVLFTITVEVPVDAPATFTVEFTGETNAKTAETAEEACTVTAGVITVAHECVAGEAVKENEVAPTCTKKGSYDLVVYCTLCKKELSRETVEVDMIPHTPAEAVKENEKAADCVNAGSYDEVVYCSVCNTELSRKTVEVAALGHDLQKSDAPEKYDCVEGYEVVTTCSRCDLKEVEKVSHDHAWGPWTATKEATYEEEGEKVRKCEHTDHGCEASETASIPVLNPEEPDPTGDITPYIAMGVLTMVALVSAAAYMLLKRKAI